MASISDEMPPNELHTNGLIDEDYLMSFFPKTGDCNFILWLNSEIVVFKKGVLRLIISTEKLL